jgi:predicted Zn-dependent protease
VAAAIAEIHLAAGAMDRAAAEAEQAVRLAPGDQASRVLLARALAGLGRYRQLLTSTEGFEGREIRLWRGVAHYELREYARARSELDRTRRAGKMPTEAAAYYALAEFAQGREPQARALLRTLTSLPSPPAIAFVARGQIDRARHRMSSAESDFETAVLRDPASLEGNCALGRLLLSAGRSADALPFLEKASLVNPFHAEARIALARAHLAGGDARAAREELAAILASEPRNAEALRAASAAALADHDPGAAQRSAELAVSVEPRNGDSWLAAAKAALARGNPKAAQRFAQKAVKLARGSASVEARHLLAEAKGGH